MPTVYTYPDAYLSKYCTVDREARATADVAAIGTTFASAWTERLVILRTYVLACLENMADPEDLFTAKLKQYRMEYADVLAQARAATPDADGIIPPIFSIPLERA